MKLITGQLKPSKGDGQGAGRADLEQPEAVLPHRLLSRAGRVLRPDDRARVGDRARPPQRLRRSGGQGRGRARARRPSISWAPPTSASAPTARACASASSSRRRSCTIPSCSSSTSRSSGMDPIGRRKTIRLIRDWAKQGKSIIVSSHILHEIESMTSNILLINNGRILAEGNVHQIRDLIDEHPHTVYIRAADPRGLAREFLARADVISLRFEPGAVVVETGEAGRVLRPADRARRARRLRRRRGADVARRQPAGRVQVPGEDMTNRHARPCPGSSTPRCGCSISR